MEIIFTSFGLMCRHGFCHRAGILTLTFMCVSSRCPDLSSLHAAPCHKSCIVLLWFKSLQALFSQCGLMEFTCQIWHFEIKRTLFACSQNCVVLEWCCGNGLWYIAEFDSNSTSVRKWVEFGPAKEVCTCWLTSADGEGPGDTYFQTAAYKYC